jgi:hypothetical protein
LKLAVLGNYSDAHPYQRAVKQAAGPEVVFLGAIYDKPVVQALRYHSLAYVHGHQVGGTNPSLVEALGAGNAVIAHENRFNRWVAADGARYFTDMRDVDEILTHIVVDSSIVKQLKANSMVRFESGFTWGFILDEYLDLLQSHLRRPL